MRRALVGASSLAAGVLMSFAGCGGKIASSSGSGVEAGAGASSGGGSGFGSSAGGGGGVGGSASGSSSSSRGGHGGGSGGTGGGSSTGSGSGSTSSGSTSGSGSGSSSGFPDDAGGSCPDDVAFTPATYPAVQAHQGVCHAADIDAFVTACGDQGTSMACTTWQDDNVAGFDGGGGTPCGNCILNVEGDGASFVSQPSPDGAQFFSPNYGACIAVLDPTNGPTCAPAYDANEDCQSYQCGDCVDATSLTTCDSAVDGTGGACANEEAAANTACSTDFADGGVATTCSPGNATGASNPDWQLIIGLICGGPDGG